MSAFVTSLADFGGAAGEDPRACSATNETTSASAGLSLRSPWSAYYTAMTIETLRQICRSLQSGHREREVGQRSVLLRSEENVRRGQPRSAASRRVQVHA